MKVRVVVMVVARSHSNLVIITFSTELAAVGRGAVGRPGSPNNVRSVAQVGRP